MWNLDLVLAILHHFFAFGLFAILFAEFMLVRRGMDAGAVVRVQSIDLRYGMLSGLILVVGFARAIFAAKGWTYYQYNAFFWAKIGTFAAIGLLSIPPTRTFLQWRRAGTVPTDEAIDRVRRYLGMEMGLFVLLPAFAAAMARGFGMW